MLSYVAGSSDIGEAVCKVFETKCSLFQYALSTRAGTDCVGHMLWAATDANPPPPSSVSMQLGHMTMSTGLGRLARMPAARALLSVRLSHGRPSSYTWVHDAARPRCGHCCCAQIERRRSPRWISKNSEKRQPSWNARASCDNPVGRNFATGSDRLTMTHATRASGHMVGNIGHPPSLTPTTGGSRC